MIQSLKKQGWFLNGQIPTGEQTQVEWNGKMLTVSVRKYTFWKGLNEDSLVVYDTSEKGAWNQLQERLEVSGMMLHASEGQTIEEFANELYNVSEVADVTGIYNDTHIHVNIWDNPESLVKKYHDIRSGKY
jgi:hypothetical protein